MTSDNRTVTRITVGREEWRKIESEESSFIIRENQSPYETVAFMFTDAFTGVHLGNAIILSATTFGGLECSPWTWNMFAKLTGMTVQELKERFPAEANSKDPYEHEMHLYEIKPISDKELLQRLCDK